MVYPREVAKMALTLGADGVVLAHNHPGGTVRPSQADLKLTRGHERTQLLGDLPVQALGLDSLQRHESYQG